MHKVWQIKQEKIPQSVEEVQQIVLENRDIENIEAFLSVSHPRELKPEDVGIDIAQLEKAVKRILLAKENKETVLIFGDYDADGITATAVLWLTMHQLGFKVLPFIPHREKHGYGISDAAIDDIVASDKPDLIITVDNGIVAHEPVRRLVEDEQIDVIITDHHQPELENEEKFKYPPAHSIIHTTELCGATVSWMLARELDEKFAISQLDLTGIATIADQVPLVGANRSFAKWGLGALSRTERIGLQKLLKAAGIDKKKITSGTVGFGIAPRINAMGRLKHGLDALRLLCTTSEKRADQLTEVLMKTNIERQDLTSDLLTTAIDQAKLQSEERIIIVASSEYHEGVVGLIAGRLTEKYHKPAIALSVNGEIAKASARSVKGVNIVELLREIQEDLLEVGGHPLAAGFSVETTKIEMIKDKLFAIGQETISSELLTPVLAVDAEIPWELVNDDLVAMTEELAPFGQANPRPVFMLNQVRVLNIRTMGTDNQHMKLSVGYPNAVDSEESIKTLNVLAWRQGELAAKIHEGDTVSLVGVLEFNHWNGRRSVQMVMRDIKR